MNFKSKVGIGDDEGGIVPRRIPPQNIVQRLLLRELHAGRRRRCNATITARIFFANVFPNYTVINVEKPACFLRKFSPDGRHLIAFSADQTSLEIYEFCGPAAAADMLNTLPQSDVAADFLPDSVDVLAAVHVRSQLFARFFKLTRVTCIAVNGESLNRECSLFTNDARYVIVGSAVYVSDEQHSAPLFHDVYRNNESICPNPRSPLEDCTLHIVSIDDGHVTDRRRFRCDKIYLSHNQGVYLYGATLAVLSVQQQTIHVFRISADGSFVDLRSIGRFCYDDDLFLLSSVCHSTANDTPANVQRRPFHDVPINCLKHRLLVHLYRRAVADAKVTATPKPILSFFRHFDEFQRLRMWKMQLLDEQHLLIRYASEDVCSLRAPDPNSQPSFFVVYDMSQADILQVFDGASDDLLNLYENFCDLLRYPAAVSDAEAVSFFASSPSTNVHARQAHERFKYSITGARYGGRTEAVRRVLAQLPISAQSYSTSPFLDLSLFSYDDKWVSAMERPKACGDHPIRFYARDSGLLKFKIHTGMLAGRNLPPPANARRLVAFMFHPSEPFAISIQRTNAEYVVNFHVRHSTTSELEKPKSG